MIFQTFVFVYKKLFAKDRQYKTLLTVVIVKWVTLQYYKTLLQYPMGIVPAPFWSNLYLSKHECGYRNDLTKK